MFFLLPFSFDNASTGRNDHEQAETPDEEHIDL
jgi:hypothetical protein